MSDSGPSTEVPTHPGGVADGPFLRANRVTLVALVLTGGLAAAVYLGTPNAHGAESVWTLLFHLTPFATATIAIGWLHLPWAYRLRLHLILPPVCFLVIFTFFVPYTFFLFAQDDAARYFDELYYTQLMMVPYLILVLVLAVRLGGARRSTVLRLAAAMLLLQLSGIEDLAFLIIRDLNTAESHPIPQVWDWADHMAARLGGHYPTREQAYAFIGAHVAAAVAVLFTPGRVVRAAARLRRGAPRDNQAEVR